MQERVHERTGRVTGAGMHDEPRRFIEDDQVVVFVNNPHRDVLGDERARRRWRQVDLHSSAEAQSGGRTAFDGPIYADPSLADPLRETASAVVRELPRQEAVEALTGVIGADLDGARAYQI